MGEGADSQGSSNRGGAMKPTVTDDDKTPAAGIPAGVRASLPPTQESRGRSSASYASATPHEIPEASKVAVHLDEPAVVVSPDTECEVLGRVDDELTNPRGSLNAVAVAVPIGDEEGDAPEEGITPVPAPPFPGPRVAGPGALRMRTPTVVITRPSRSSSTWVAKAGAFAAMLLLVSAVGGFMISRTDSASQAHEEEPVAPPPVRVVAVSPPPTLEPPPMPVAAAPSSASAAASPAVARDAGAAATTAAALPAAKPLAPKVEKDVPVAPRASAFQPTQ